SLTPFEKHEIKLQEMGLDSATIQKADEEKQLKLITVRMIEQEAFRKQQKQSQKMVNPFRR
ncbi:hypothetical protein H5976_08805, partial [Streptococcus alactolyticus]|uniref:hypothetical protein n=1 Tax=Streptococcus alactolyticus TaxID=29389 RepID=UPI00195CAE51